MMEIIENVEREINDIQHSKVRLISKPPLLPSSFTGTGSLAEYPMVCETLLKHHLLSETEPDLSDCQSSSNAEPATLNVACRAEPKLSKPVISSPLKCVSSAVNEIEAKTSKKQGAQIIGGRRSQQMRSMLPRTIPRKSVQEKK